MALAVDRAKQITITELNAVMQVNLNLQNHNIGVLPYCSSSVPKKSILSPHCMVNKDLSYSGVQLR